MSQEPENFPKKAHFANENLEVELEFRPHCGVRLRLQIQPAAIEAASQLAFKNLKKGISVPGFRKGKAPDAFVRKHYEKAWQEEAKEIAMRIGLRETMQLSQLKPMNGFQKIIFQEWSEEKGYIFTAECEIAPELPLVDLNSLHLEKVNPAVVSDRLLDLRLHKVLMPLATLQPITDRGVQVGDVGELDVVLLVDPPRQLVTKQRLEIEEEEFTSWMCEQMQGMRAGETRRLEPSEAEQQKGACPLEVHLHEVFSVCWPNLTDEEVLNQLKVESEENLRNKLRDRLEKEAVLHAKLDTSRQLATELLRKYSFDLPTAIVYPRYGEYLHVYSEKNKEDIAANELASIRRYLLQKAVEETQLEMLVKEIGQKHGLILSEEDLRQELLFQLELLTIGKNQINVLEKRSENRETLRHLALLRKIEHFLLSKTPHEAQPALVDSQEG